MHLFSEWGPSIIMKFSILGVALFASTTLVSVSSKKFKGDQLKAKFDFGTDLTATVIVRQIKGQKEDNAATWRVKIKEFDSDLCPSGPDEQGKLNWHVHEYPGNGIRAVGTLLNTSATACDGDVTGGHYDPTFACGGASQNNANGVCAFLRAQPQSFPTGSGLTGNVTAANSYDACKPDNQSSCEIGDQSGKLGKLTTTKLKKWQKFKDEWMTPIDNLEGRSLVLHCCYAKFDGSGTSCGPRLACANLE